MERRRVALRWGNWVRVAVMNWFQIVALSLGIVDATAVLIAGLISTALALSGRDDNGKTSSRLWMACISLVGTSFAAVVILQFARWMAS